MGNSLDMNFAVDTQKVANADYVTIKKGDTTQTVALEDCEKVGGYYVIPYKGLAAKEMGDLLKVAVYDQDDNQIAPIKNDSIASYVNRIFDTTQDELLKRLLVDMLNYGAAAQQAFGYDTDNLVSDVLTAEQKSFGTQTKPVCINDRYITGDTSVYGGTNFVLENQISMQMRVKTTAITGGRLEVSFTDHYGQEKTATMQAEDGENRGDYTVFAINEIVAADNRQDITCKFYDSQGDLVVTVVDSLEAYVSRMGQNYPWLYEIMKYSDSAYAYLHQGN